MNSGKLFQEEKTFIIAEIANAHEGDPDLARSMIGAFKDVGADAVKFQIFSADELATPDYPHYSLYQKLQMERKEWEVLVELAHQNGLLVFADVFGLQSAQLAYDVGVDGFKVHVADISNEPLLEQLGASGRAVILSAGGSTWIETARAVQILSKYADVSVAIIYGFQAYPTELEDSYLRRLTSLKMRFDLPIGFAGHVSGDDPDAINIPVWAVAAGASIIESHITMDRSKQGLDYYSALEPDQFSLMVNKIRYVEQTLGRTDFGMGQREIEYRQKHKKCLVATRELPQNYRITADDVALKRVPDPPAGTPLSANDVVGKETLHPIKQDAPITRNNFKMRVVATLACRAESKRLYAKPMQNIGGRPILSHLIEQLNRISAIDEIVLAISDTPSQYIFIDYALKNNLRYIVGDEKDVLGRLIEAAGMAEADIVVRTTTENPYIYWQNADQLIHQHIKDNIDLSVTEKLPLGSFLEIVTLSALRKSHDYGEDRHRSELCTLFIAENPEVFQIHRVTPPEHLQRPHYRLTTDTTRDLFLMQQIWDDLHEDGVPISVERIIGYLDERPELAIFNTNNDTLYVWK